LGETATPEPLIDGGAGVGDLLALHGQALRQVRAAARLGESRSAVPKPLMACVVPGWAVVRSK